MKLSYLAYNGAGQMVRDSIESTSAVDATDTLRQQGLFVTQICAMGQASKVKSPSVTRWRLTGRTRRLKNLAMFSRHLHVLTSSGTALTDALAALERQASDNSFRDVIADLRRHVEQGVLCRRRWLGIQFILARSIAAWLPLLKPAESSRPF